MFGLRRTTERSDEPTAHRAATDDQPVRRDGVGQRDRRRSKQRERRGCWYFGDGDQHAHCRYRFPRRVSAKSCFRRASFCDPALSPASSAQPSSTRRRSRRRARALLISLLPLGPFRPVRSTRAPPPINVITGQTTTLAAGNFSTHQRERHAEPQRRHVFDAEFAAKPRRTRHCARGVDAAGRDGRRCCGSLANSGSRSAAGRQLAPDRQRSHRADTSVTLGTDVQLRALVTARNVLRSADRLLGSGAISGQEVIFGNDAQLAFNTGFGCTTAADCNDNSTCTTIAA